MDPQLSGYLQVIAQEWKARKGELADWALKRLVNRRDVWGQYTTMSARERQTSERGYKAVTLPQKKLRGKDMVTREKLLRHFGSARRNHLIGLHAIGFDDVDGAGSAEEPAPGEPERDWTCRWMAIDIDLHHPEAVDSEDQAARNFAAAEGWWEELQKRGYEPLILDSNGAGGYHVWTLFETPAPAADVYAFAQELVSQWEKRNLDGPPETFPKSGTLGGNKLGAWLRLPGLHHTRDHYTKVWSGEPWLDEPWQEGNAAIDAILEATPGPPPPRSDGDTTKAKAKAKRKKTKSRGEGRATSTRAGATGKATICVDLDGVLAQYEGWSGLEQIGDPVGGAVEFTRRLAKFARVVIHTARVKPGRKTAEVKRIVESWLEEHEISYDDIHVGAGKPGASAYIDDRAVRCRPQEDGPLAFQEAERLARELCALPVVNTEAKGVKEVAELTKIWSELNAAAKKKLLREARAISDTER